MTIIKPCELPESHQTSTANCLSLGRLRMPRASLQWLNRASSEKLYSQALLALGPNKKVHPGPAQIGSVDSRWYGILERQAGVVSWSGMVDERLSMQALWVDYLQPLRVVEKAWCEPLQQPGSWHGSGAGVVVWEGRHHLRVPFHPTEHPCPGHPLCSHHLSLLGWWAAAGAETWRPCKLHPLATVC